MTYRIKERKAERLVLAPDEISILRLTKGLTAREARDRLMHVLAIASLKAANGNHGRAAKRLGVHRNTLSRLVNFRIPEKTGGSDASTGFPKTPRPDTVTADASREQVA